MQNWQPLCAKNVPLSSCFMNKGDKTWNSGFVEKQHYQLFTPRRHLGFFSNHSQNFPLPSSFQQLSRAYFGGVLFPYYGHFLLESLAFLPNIPDDDTPILFMCLQSTIKSWHRQFFEDIGIAHRLRFTAANQLTWVDQLLKVDQTTIIRADISSRFIHYTSQLFQTEPSSQPDTKIYISRRNSTNAPIENEAALEAELIQLGFKIVAPETLSIREQVQLYNNASIIAAVEGSALHTLVMTHTAKTILMFARRTETEFNFTLQFAMQPQLRVVQIHAMERYAKTFNDSAVLDVAQAVAATRLALQNT